MCACPGAPPRVSPRTPHAPWRLGATTTYDIGSYIYIYIYIYITRIRRALRANNGLRKYITELYYGIVSQDYIMDLDYGVILQNCITGLCYETI